MTKRLQTSLLILWACATVSLADDMQTEARRLVAEGKIRPLEVILDSVRAQHSGRLLEAELESGHGRYLYEIELLDPSGVVWELKIDAESGELIDKERED